MEPGRNSFPPFQDGGGGPRDEDNKKAAPMRAPPSRRECWFLRACWIRSYSIRIVKLKIVTVIAFSAGQWPPAALRAGRLPDAIAAIERSNFIGPELSIDGSGSAFRRRGRSVI